MYTALGYVKLTMHTNTNKCQVLRAAIEPLSPEALSPVICHAMHVRCELAEDRGPVMLYRGPVTMLY